MPVKTDTELPTPMKGIFFPDNENRKIRLLELSKDTQYFMNQAQDAYKKFTSLNTEINQKIFQLYLNSGLKPPQVTNIDILKIAGAVQEAGKANTTIEVIKLIIDAGGMIALPFLTSGAINLMVGSGIMAAETAATALGTVLGAEIIIGTIAGGILIGIVIISIDFLIDAITGDFARQIAKWHQKNAST